MRSKGKLRLPVIAQDCHKMNASRIRRTAGVVLATVLFSGLTAATASLDPAGPHLDGNAYDALRPQDLVSTLTFDLKLETQGQANRTRITLGPDFVAEESEDFVRIYDFRFHRVLHIDTDSGYFSNESLYGHFRSRWALFRNNMFVIDVIHQTGGKTERPLNLERFLVEHYIGIAGVQKIHRQVPPTPPMDIRHQDMELIINVEGAEILRAAFDPIKFPSTAHRQTFAAWLIWQIRVHPKIAQAIVETNMLPAYLQTVDQNPGQPKDPVRSLTFSRTSRSSGRLDMLPGLTPDIPDSPHLPEKLARLMIDAAHGRASNRSPEDSVYKQNIRKLMSGGHYLDAALLSHHASLRYEGCGPPHAQEVELCDLVFSTYRVAVGKADSASKLFQAMHLMQEKKHEQVVEMLLPLRKEVHFRPDILEFMIANEIVEARRTAQQTASRQDAEQQAAARELYKDEINRLPDTFTAALAADPYAAVRYRDILNYFSVGARDLNEKYHAPILEHFVLDLARALPGQTMPSIINHITDMEARIAEEHPMLFPKTTGISE